MVHIDYALSAREELTIDQMRNLVRIVREVPKPLLVHCSAGADRTGLVSALYELDRGQPPKVAVKQLSIFYGHFPWLGSRTIAMDQSFAMYVAAGHEIAGSRKSGEPPASTAARSDSPAIGRFQVPSATGLNQ